jgi:hypothetical protein
LRRGRRTPCIRSPRALGDRLVGQSDSFEARLTELAQSVGQGTLHGSVVVDQVYAQYQHEGLDLKHPSGGVAKYLESPLYGKHRDYFQRIADHVLAGDLISAMADNVESLSRQVYELAPREFHDLRASGHPSVTDQGSVVYDRLPNVHRLTSDELAAKSHLRALGFGHEF